MFWEMGHQQRAGGGRGRDSCALAAKADMCAVSGVSWLAVNIEVLG